MTTVLVAGLIAGIVLSIVVIIVLYRAISNVLNWAILTFGNDESARRVKEKRGGNDEGID